MCGVRRAKANPWTRNVLIVFDENALDVDTLLETPTQIVEAVVIPLTEPCD